jgi:hypothetical protein
MVLLLILYRTQLLSSGFSRIAWFAATALSAASLYFSYARVSWAILASVLIVFALFRLASFFVQRPDIIHLMTTLPIWLAVLIIAFPLWQGLISGLDELRPGSSVARFDSYTEGWEVVTTGAPLQSIAGIGVKPFLEELGRGAGSESTYVSLLVRGGLIALTLFVVFIAARAIHAYRARDWAGLLVIAALAGHALVADLDVGTLTLLFGLATPAGSGVLLGTGKSPPSPPGVVRSGQTEPPQV